MSRRSNQPTEVHNSAQRLPLLPTGVRTRLYAAILVSASACTGAPNTDYAGLPEFLYVPIDETGVIDRRSEFASIFCALLKNDQAFSGRPCTDFLHLGHPGAFEVMEAPAIRSDRLRYLIVPGYGTECYPQVATPYENAREALRGEGIDVELLMVPGRASTSQNAEFIAQALRSEEAAARVVLIGYSKGLADILEAVAEYPDALSHVVAVVGISGVVNGSPLVNDTPMLMRLLHRLPLNRCEPSNVNDDGLLSMSYEYRQNWLATHRIDPRILYFSLATYATADEVSSGLKSSYRKLARIDPRNDGLMIYRDAIIPGSNLLALARGDHWAVAIPFSGSNTLVRSMIANRNDFPRTVLLRSIMIAVQSELGARRE